MPSTTHHSTALSRRQWMTGAAALLLAAGCGRHAEGPQEPLRIAVAANFAPALTQIVAKFRAEQKHAVEVSSGSTGKLYAQITHGAPLDIFLSADSERPERLEREGHAVAHTRFRFAVGRIVVYGPALKHPEDGINDLKAGDFKKLSIANPETAPYGVAAQQLLEKLGLWQALSPRIVRGENITQALQFVQSGAAELGILAWSTVIDRPRSSYFLVPEPMHAPIVQEGILLKRAEHDERARAFLDFMRSDAVKGIIARAGYDVPRV